MKIAILVEGNTERAFSPSVRQFLDTRLPGRMPSLKFFPYHGRLEKAATLKKTVERHLQNADAVIALTDVYTGRGDFADASDAKRKMRQWVGPSERFFPHAAQYEFEAWLLPYRSAIESASGNGQGFPNGNPESVNHHKPPSRWLADIFRTGRTGRSYSKVRDATRILRNQDLTVAAHACPELKAFLNTILRLCEADCLE